MAEQRRVISGAIWMTALSVLFFWLPVLGPLLAGLMGGKKAGGVGSAVLAVFVPGIVLSLLLLVFSSLLTGLPVVGMVFAGAGFLFYVADVGLLLVGALVGGLLA